MTWQNVAISYFNLFNECAKIKPRKKDKLPPIKLDYLRVLTDDFGMIQFANHTKPDPASGYCLDDNARALLGCAMYYNDARNKNALLNLINIYLNFIKFVQKSNGKFNNFVSFEKHFIDQGESEDSFGRAIWTLGYIIAHENLDEKIKKQAETILKKTIKFFSDLKSLRAISFTLIGLSYIAIWAGKNKKESEEKKHIKDIKLAIKKLADKLLRRYIKETLEDKNWLWFEDCLTYSNYKLPEALFRAYQITKNRDYLRIAEESIKFLNSITFETQGYMSPIGQNGWYFKDGQRAFFDQQPEDASSAVEALAAAYLVTKKKSYLNSAKVAFDWFLGANHLNQMIYDEATGGCYDGLGKFSINFNQGAESSISYFIARLSMEEISK